MTDVAHRLLGLVLLVGLTLFAGCKSATPADSQQANSQEVTIPMPEPTPGPAADVVVNTPQPVDLNKVNSSAPVGTPSRQQAAPAPMPTPKPAPVAKVEEPEPTPNREPAPQPVAQAQPKPQPAPAEIKKPEAPAPLWSLKYPGDKQLFAGDIDITVIQDSKSIKLTNRTVTSYKNVQVWVNQRYVTRVDNIPVGKTTSIPLKHLINQYGEKYPTPGLFRPDRSFPALLVEIYEPDQNKRYRLIVQKTHSQF